MAANRCEHQAQLISIIGGLGKGICQLCQETLREGGLAILAAQLIAILRLAIGGGEE